jgi:hypothetical protein
MCVCANGHRQCGKCVVKPIQTGCCEDSDSQLDHYDVFIETMHGGSANEIKKMMKSNLQLRNWINLEISKVIEDMKVRKSKFTNEIGNWEGD